MSKIFLYPKADKMIGSPNPYILNFIDALSQNHIVVNSQAKNKGVFNLFKYLPNTDIFIFNWIENLPEKKFGKLQVVLFVVFMGMAKLLGKKIIWILHNKYSHHLKENRWVDFLYSFMMKYADKIITHSNSGLDFVKSSYPKFPYKVEVITHPVTSMFDLEPIDEKNYDFIIWGTIFPYKGIDMFLKFLKESPDKSHYKVLLIGKCFDEKYKNTIESLLTDNIVFYDQIFDLQMIAQFSNQSKFTLFTYKSNSVISSGSLIDAIRMGSVIIGPNHGGFKDLSHYGFLNTYDSYEDIFRIHREYTRDIDKEKEEGTKFYEENNWNAFIQKLENIFNEL